MIRGEFTCHCCGTIFNSSKPKDPARDTGFGTCDRCFSSPLGVKRSKKEQAEVLKTKRFA